MSKRYYIASIIGDGSFDNPFRTKVSNYNVNHVSVIETDPIFGSPTAMWGLVLVDTNDHRQLINDSDIDDLPDFPLDAKISAMHTGTRQIAQGIIDKRGIGVDMSNADGYRDVIRGIGKKLNPNFDENNFDVTG